MNDNRKTEIPPDKPPTELLFKLEDKSAHPDENDPWKDDALSRKELADGLINFIDKETAPFVISINGQWGCGKTFFLKRLQSDLDKNNFQTIYFNAWEDDFHADPLVAIIGQLVQHFGNEKGYKRLMAKIKKAAQSVSISISIPLDLSVLGLTVLAIRASTGLKKATESNIDLYNKANKSKTELREALKKLAEPVQKKTQHPLVFIVDELDRCRPLFSIMLLERIKHIFNIPNMIFIFGVNQEQLSKSIQKVYGDIKADEYLQRFFDVIFLLPLQGSREFCLREMERHNFDEFYKEKSQPINYNVRAGDFEPFKDYLPVMCEELGLSLREIQQCLIRFVFVSKQIKDEHFMNPVVLAVLLLLKIKKQNLYTRYIAGQQYVTAEVLNYFESIFENNHETQKLWQGFNEIFNPNIFRALVYLTAFPNDLKVINELITEDKHSSSSVQGNPHLSKATQQLDEDEWKRLCIWYQRERNFPELFGYQTLAYLDKKINLLSPP